MSLLYLVRHGEAAASYDEHPDPGLSAHGRTQAEQVAERLTSLGPSAVVSSPMARAQETAAPLAQAWATPVIVNPAVSEIPSPGLSPADRGPWLQRVMSGTWADTTAEVRAWRDGIVEAMLAIEGDAVVFSHFVAINAAISAATGGAGPLCRHLDHCSVTTFEANGSAIRLVATGDEADTTIL